MKKARTIILLIYPIALLAQGPEVTSWLFNTTGVKASHYVQGNSSAIQDNDSANVQSALYSSNWVYVRTKGLPSYTTGPFIDGNPSLATNQNAIWRH